MQSLTSEIMNNRTASTADGATLDVSAEGFWGYQIQRVFFDINVSCPLAQSYHDQSLGARCKKNEKEMKRKCYEVIRDPNPL